ncbi:hemerythrin domain-containing protein [Capillibacterium thermochitinicola]|uniref:Hemerythrin domain-containing protein n=1 Tax=Capillibacterium thermochitinicola TaxID=2699427 RepID=A0A8J6HZM7_9FIRM|nr:hemerythrin domain-containing protein [Capillibacterium thermochitinicola]MBA2132855.1 hemerythrin domain-containing protein [Capillibacterium thermochitinicola]
MEYLARITLEHQGIQEMLQVQKELNQRLKKAKGVNIVHLENTLRFWRDFLAQEHMSWEEEFAFALYRKLNHGLPERLQGDHERIKAALAKLEATIKPLSSGRPNAGREFVRWGEEFTATVTDHLARENTALLALKGQGETGQDLGGQPEDAPWDRLRQLVQVADELCQEYLQRPSALRSRQENMVAVEEGPEQDREPGPVETGGIEGPPEAETGEACSL